MAKCTSEARRLLRTQGLPVPDDMRPPGPSGYGHGYITDHEEEYWEESEPSEVLAGNEATDPDHPWFLGSELYGAEPEEITARAALQEDPECQVAFDLQWPMQPMQAWLQAHKSGILSLGLAGSYEEEDSWQRRKQQRYKIPGSMQWAVRAA